MNIESSLVFRRVVRVMCLVLTAGFLPAGAAVAQLPISFTPGNPPPVLSGSVIPFNHGATGVWAQIYSMKIAPNGTILFLDSANSNLYALAPGASEPTLLVGPGTASSGANNCKTLEASSTYWNAGLALDSANNLYFGNRYSSLAPFCRVPFDTSTNSWDFGSSALWGPPSIPATGGGTTVLNPQEMYIPPCGSSCSTNTMYFSTSGAAGGDAIYEVTFTPSTGTLGTITPIITGLQDLAASIAIDQAGNVYFTENIYPTAVNDRVSGVRVVPAGTTNVTCTGNGSEATQTSVIAGTGAYTGIGGITLDAQGNLYFGSINNASYNGYVDGVFMVPNEGTPASPNLVGADMVMVSPVSGSHDPLVDPRGFLWVATGGSNNWSPTGTLAPTCDTTSIQTEDATCLASSIVIWKPGAASLGSAAVNGATPVQLASYSVVAAGGTLDLFGTNTFAENQVVTISAGASDPLYPLNGLSFLVQGSPLTGNEFAVSSSAIGAGLSGPTSATVTLSPYSAVYFMFNQATTLSSFGLGQSAGNFKVIGNPLPNTSLTTPVPPCTPGATYPAFSPVEETTGNPPSDYSWCALNVQLNTQTAGTVQSDFQILNSGSSVVTGSNIYVSGVGQGAAISSLAAPTAYSVASGLTTPTQVAVDAQGDTFVADKSNKLIEFYPAGTTSPTAPTVQYGTGLSAPTGVAVDGAGDLFIGDSGNVYEIPYTGGKLQKSQQTKIASGLGAKLSLAADSMGDVFVADQTNKQVVEVPNGESAILVESSPVVKLASGTTFTGPSAIATDNSGNVWVADGTDLWEITMPFGGATEITTQLPSGATGLAVDPSGSVFVAASSGLDWIPYQVSGTSAGLSINGIIQIAPSFGSGPAAPIAVALDGSDNAYVDYGANATAGLSLLNINGAINFNSSNNYPETNPAVPYEVDAQLFNLGNTPLTLATFSGDVFTPGGETDYTIIPATLNTPACSASSSVSPGNACYFGLQLLATAPNAADDASVNILSNAANATSGLNVALSADVVQDPRPATTVTVSFAAAAGANCGGGTYPGCQTATVTVTSTAGTPGGTVIIKVPGSGVAQQEQSATLNGSGQATFPYANLAGGTYNVLVTYGGQGSLSCVPANGQCFAGSATTTTFTIARATPAFTVGPPGSEGCLTWTQTDCAPIAANLTYYLGTYFVDQATSTWFTASVSSTVGTPTGSVSFLADGQPVDATQPQSSLSGTGIANFTLSNLATGTYTLTAQYNGDQNYLPEDVTLPVFQVIVPSVEITATPAAVTTKAGTAVQTTLNVMPLVEYSGQISLQCVSASLPQYAECTFAYPNSGQGTITVSGTSPSTVVVTISTNVPVNSGTTGSLVRQEPWALAGLFGAGLLGLIAGRKRFHRYLTMVCLALMLSGAFMAMTSCTNAGYSTPPPAPKVQTPAGTYNVQITGYNPATLQQVSLANTPPYTVQLTVQ